MTSKRVSPGRAMYQAAEALQRKSEAQAERIAELEAALDKAEAKHDAERADHDKTCQRIAELEQQVEALRDALSGLIEEDSRKMVRRSADVTRPALSNAIAALAATEVR